jgi:hypothetical protein
MNEQALEIILETQGLPGLKSIVWSLVDKATRIDDIEDVRATLLKALNVVYFFQDMCERERVEMIKSPEILTWGMKK